MGKMFCILVVLGLWSGTASAKVPRCRALDARDGALILEIANRSPRKCSAMLTTAMKKRRCAPARHPKTFEYESQYDHRGMRGTFVTVSCARPAPPPVPECRALELSSKKTIAEVAQKSSKRCAALLAVKVKKARCTRARRGKKLEYRARFEQRGAKDRRVTLVCKK